MPRTPLLASSKDYTPSTPDQRVSFLEQFPKPPHGDSEMRKYRLLSPTAGIRVSPLALGANSLGDQLSGFLGGNMSPEDSFKYLDAFYEEGGNFIDSAGAYQDEQAEMIIGEWMEERQNRDEMVIATKYSTFPLHRKEGPFKGIGVNYGGNAKKNLLLSVESSLKKLKTNYIDILYIHWWDYTSSIPEIMRSLDDLVKLGKVLYLGISNTPAWIVAQANEYARQNSLSQFVVYQGLYNVGSRDMERDIIPMVRSNGMSISPYYTLGGGMFKTAEEIEKRKKAGTLRMGLEPSPQQVKVAKVLQEVADELGGNWSIPNVALAWSRHAVAECIPVIGGTSIENLKSNIAALSIKLTPEQMEKLNNAIEFDLGFPLNLIGDDPHYSKDGTTNIPLLYTAGNLQYTKLP